MNELALERTAKPVSRDQILRRERGQEKIVFPVQLKTSKSLVTMPRLMPSLVNVTTIHTNTHTWYIICMYQCCFNAVSSPSRARSLRNLLVSGNECGRVFPAGVGPGSPSRNAANWLPSRFSLSVETRRRYGWLRMMVFPGARLFPSPNLVPFGRVAARERQGALSRRAW